MEIDPGAQIDTVARTVRPAGERDGQELFIVASTRPYAVDVDDLWDALTSQDRLPRWFLPISGDLRLGGRYQLEGNAGGEILVCQPPRRLAVTWEFAGQLSWLEVLLTAEKPGSTRLDLEHTIPADDHWRQFGPGATGVGWDMGLTGLAEHLATGAAADPAAAMAWLGSADGRAFIARSSAAWARAAVVAGMPEPDATAAAARTTAFYSGG